MSDRLARLSDLLNEAADARHMATTHVWSKAWEGFERELLDRFRKCGPDEDWQRYRIQIAFEVVAYVRKAVEHEGKTVDSLQREIDHIEGRKPYQVA